MRQRPIFSAVILSAAAWLGGLSAHVSPAAEPAVDFQRDIRPILSNACFDCHGPDAKARKAKLRLDLPLTGALTRSGDQAIIMPGKPAQSELVRRITAADAAERMPPVKHTRQLKAGEIELLRRWIAEGAKWQTHWALASPRRPALPRVAQGSWPRNGIDAFILARLEKEGLRPTAEADRTTLIRRVTLDLTGLPPTPKEVDAFLADTSVDAYEKLVDRLLASPRYGERMAIDWLDAARYADTNGYQVDRDREMWPWRDWVVGAFNRNLPFDQFTIEQLAGDLLPGATRDQRVATGLHRNHLLNEEGGVIPEEFLAEYIADRVETTATVWLGLTMGCARCHDHKYDPFTQKDFYGLYAFFHNVPESGLGNYGAIPKLSAPPHLKLETPEQQKKLDQLAAAIAKLDKQLAAPVPALAKEQEAWEKSLAEAMSPSWFIVEPADLKSQAGATLTKLEDKSVLATGIPPETDTYSVTARTEAATITALRLEVLPHKRLPKMGPGRALNGNFVLTDFRLSVDGQVRKFKAASADFSQQSFPVEHAIDAMPYTGWAVHPELGKPHTAVFELAEPLPVTTNTPLMITLDFQSQVAPQHEIGRFRLAVTTSPRPHAYALPTAVAKLLAIPADKRTAAQKTEIHDYFRQNASPTLKKLQNDLAKLKQERAKLETDVPTMMVMSELPKPRDTFILIRGEYTKKGEKVGPATPVSLHAFAKSAPPNRLGLAKWLVDPANPLTARVTVNRYWQLYFGTGLVRTTEDFGSQGESPSHPDLLDWLASEFVSPLETKDAPRQGWDIRGLQKLIVTSATYRQASRLTPVLLERDPENRLLARGPRLRLPAEMIRDQALAASGLLVEKRGGPPVKPYHPAGMYELIFSGSYVQGKGPDLYRRSLYTYWKRSVPHPAMLTFDAPFRESCTVRRPRTSTPLQALNLMNDPTYVEAARFLAQRMMQEHKGNPRSASRTASA